MRHVHAIWLASTALAVASGVGAQEAVPPTPTLAPAGEAAPADQEPARPTDVVVLASGGVDVTEEALSQARAATVSTVALDQARHGRVTRPEHDPGLAVRAAECSDDACLGAVARDAGAGFLFVLMVERWGAGYRASVLLVDAEASQTVGSAAVDLPTEPAGFVEAMRAPLGPLVVAVRPVGPTTGRLIVTADQDGAAVFVDGERVGTTPLPPIDGVAAGEHQVRVTCDGFVEHEARVDVAAGGEARVAAALVPVPPEERAAGERPFWRRWWFWTIVGGVVVTGTAVGLGVGLSQSEGPGQQFGVPFPTYEER
jgi:hypothetical protein